MAALPGLARVCQFDLDSPSYNPIREFRVLRGMIRYRRKLLEDRSRVRKRIQELLDRNGPQLGWVPDDTFGPSGPRHFYRPS